MLAATGSAVSLLAGCSAETTPDGTDDDTTETTAASTSTDVRTETPEPTVRLEPTAPPSDSTLLVYPTDLRSWLRTAATEDRTLRVHATASVPAPNPPLSAYDRVQLTDASADVEGRYEVGLSSGIRYEYIAGAEAVDPPEGAEVTPISSLSDERRSLVEAAVAGEWDRARFYPETRLGQWVRTQFFDGYVRADGTVYRGHEVQQTDAAFFSRECWYVLSLSLTDDGPAPSLSLASVDPTVRRTLDDLFADRNPREAVTRAAGDLPQSFVRFAVETDHVLTHAGTFEVSVNPGS